MTKEERNKKQLKKNLQWELDNFDKLPEGNLRAIAVSCKNGVSVHYYGSDPIDNEVKRFSKEVQKEVKTNKRKKK